MSIQIAQAGYGYWGRNLMRVFAGAKGARMAAACDSSPEARAASISSAD